MEKSILRSVAAIVAGLLTIAIVAKLIDVGLQALHAYPLDKLDERAALIASGQRVLVMIAGGWLVARLAPGKPRLHALILGGVAALLNVPGIVMTWNSDFAPRWYLLALAVLAVPACSLGGWLFARSRRSA